VTASAAEVIVESTNNMARHLIRFGTAGALCVSAWACGSSAPTQELVDARRAYERAQASPATEYTPDQLLTARQALDRAEAAHEDDPGSATEAHLAYLAARKSQIAAAQGKAAESKAMQDKADATYQARLKEAATSSQDELAKAHSELEEARQAQSAAEQRAATALQSLSEVAIVKEEERGTVITLSGAVLFPSGGDTLSPTAQQSLEQVATALRDQPPERPIVIEGHTDSRGATEMNEQLSQRRAQAVANYLSSHGVDMSRLQVVGKGEENPIASNDTTDGRASNRRVEIVLGGHGSQPATTYGARPTQTPGSSAKSLPEDSERHKPMPTQQRMQQQPQQSPPAPSE
jgi:outer membrane protein OmpA-like peptidoglycan-associated protein